MGKTPTCPTFRRLMLLSSVLPRLAIVDKVIHRILLLPLDRLGLRETHNTCRVADCSSHSTVTFTPVSIVTMATENSEPTILTLPLDLLKSITTNLESTDEKSLKQTCKRMNLLIAPPPAAHAHAHAHPTFLAVRNDPPPRDGRSTPIPQSPMPFKATQTLAELEQENREVEDRERSRGMELSDTEDGFDTEDDRSVVDDGSGKPTKFKGKRNILSWTTQVGGGVGSGTAPSSPALRSPSGASFVHSPRAASPSPRLPSFEVTSS